MQAGISLGGCQPNRVQASCRLIVAAILAIAPFAPDSAGHHDTLPAQPSSRQQCRPSIVQ